MYHLDHKESKAKKGDQGDIGIVDTTNYYNNIQTDFAILVARPTSRLSTGAKVFDASSNTIRNIAGQNGLHTFIFMDPTDPGIHNIMH